MNQHELETLLTDHSPEEIRQQFGPQLDDSNFAFLAEFEGFEIELDQFSTDYAERLPPAPPLPNVSTALQPVKVAWFKKKITLPIWKAGSALAAMILIAILALYPGSTPKDGGSGSQWALLEWTRSDSEQGELRPYNLKLIDALLDRGFYFFQQDTEEGFKQALTHFTLANQIDPQHIRTLKYLILVCDALGKKAESQAWRNALEKREKEQNESLHQ